LPSSGKKGEKVNYNNKIYEYDGKSWIEISSVKPTPQNVTALPKKGNPGDVVIYRGISHEMDASGKWIPDLSYDPATGPKNIDFIPKHAKVGDKIIYKGN
jgi:hypothetical protein